jgi:PPOX class probable F420-dependent enzyme
VSRRDQIAFTAEERRAFLDEQRVMTCATNGRDGWPHLMPLWYVLRGEEIWAWTYAKSQKVRNLERDPRATLQVETGVAYQELRGVMAKCDVVLHRDTGDVVAVGGQLYERYSGTAVGDEFMDVVRKQAAKRVALQFVPRDWASWDHRKLGGVY